MQLISTSKDEKGYYMTMSFCNSVTLAIEKKKKKKKKKNKLLYCPQVEFLIHWVPHLFFYFFKASQKY